MILDKEEHRQILLELIDKASFPGAVRNAVVELANAIEKASVKSGSASIKKA
jgi:hypothetical protein